jgi:hypothetical protein
MHSPAFAFPPTRVLPFTGEGLFDPNKISGVGTSFGLLVHVLPGPNKQFLLKPSIILS